MARRGRKRKQGEREANGRIKRNQQAEERVEPTAEMKIRKAQFNMDWSDPLEWLAQRSVITHEQAEAISTYRSLCRADFAGVGPNTSIVSPWKEHIDGSRLASGDEEREQRLADRREAADKALHNAGVDAERVVRSMIHENGEVWLERPAQRHLRAGANWLIDHFKRGRMAA
jgi:hypothetical protein